MAARVVISITYFFVDMSIKEIVNLIVKHGIVCNNKNNLEKTQSTYKPH